MKRALFSILLVLSPFCTHARATDKLLLKSLNAAIVNPIITAGGKEVIATDNGDINSIVLINAADESVIRKLQFFNDKDRTYLYSFALSPNGKYLAAAGYTYLKIWDTATGKTVKEWNLGPWKKDPDDMSNDEYHMADAVRFSADGSLIAYGTTDVEPEGTFSSKRRDHAVVIRKTSDWSEVRTFKDVWAQATGFSPDNSYISISAITGNTVRSSTVRVFQVKDGKELDSPATDFDIAFSAFSFDPRMLVVTQKNLKNMASRWNIGDAWWAAGAMRFPPPTVFEPYAYAITPDGKYLAVGGRWQLNPKTTQILVYKVSSAQLAGAFDDGAESSHSYLSVSPDGGTLLSADSYGGSGKLWNLTGLIEQSEAEIAAISAEIAKSPQSPEGYKRRGVAHLNRHELKEAIGDFTTAIGMAPKDAELYNYRALANDEMGDSTAAIADYTKFMEMGGESTAVLKLRALAKEAKGDHEGAMQDLDKVIKLSPHDALAFQLRGKLAMDHKDYQMAVTEFTQAIAAAPKESENYVKRGDAFVWASDDCTSAIKDYTKAIELDPLHARAYKNRNYCQAVAGEFQKALADTNKAIEIGIRTNNLDPDAYFRRGAVYMDLKKYDDAHKDFEQANLLGAKPRSLYTLARIDLEKYNDMTLGIVVQEFEEVVRRDPQNAEYKEWLEKARAKYDAYEQGEVNKIMAARQVEMEQKMSIYRSIGDVSKAILAGANAGGGGGGGYSGYSGGSSSGGSSFSGGNSGPDYAAQNQERNRLEQDRANRQQIENRLWNMNNPYNRR